jgi:formylglycine-generating enzyme required for sulfatase activity
MYKKHLYLWPFVTAAITLFAFVFSGCPMEPEDDSESPVVYTINFDVNGGEALEESSKTLTSPPDITLGSLPVPAHSSTTKIFNGWYTAADGGIVINSSYLIEDIEWVSGAITLYAQWGDTQQVATYTLGFNANGGTVDPASKQLVTPGVTTVGTLPVPSHPQAAFAGWYTQANGGTQIDDDMAISGLSWSNYTLTVYAHWTLTINLDVNEGNALDPAVISLSSPFAATLGNLPTPTHGTKYFTGWYTAADGGVQISASTTIAGISWVEGAITLYAQWSDTEPEIRYTLSFNANGGTVDPPASIEVITTASTAAATPLGTLPTPTHATLIFAGWFTAASGGTLVDENTTVTSLAWSGANTITLYAHWASSVIRYTITYDADGGILAESQKIIDSPPAITVGELPDPTKSGSLFMGWYTQQNGAGIKVSPETLLTILPWTANAITIYANWRAGTSIAYSITLNAGGGSVTPSTINLSYPTDTTVGTLPTPVFGDKNFSGWYTQQTGGIKVTAETNLLDLPGETITLYAKWGATPALHYDFSGSGSTVPDLAGNNNGTLNGGATLGLHNGIGYMDTGSGDGYLDMGATAGQILTGQDEFTLSVFVNTTSTVGGNGYDLWSFSDTADTTVSGSVGRYIFFRTVGMGHRMSLTGWNSETSVSATGNLTSNTWKHILVRQNGNTGTIFIDGQMVNTNTAMSIKPTDLAAEGELIYNYLSRPCFSGNTYMKSTKFADFRIYDTALSDEEIAAMDIIETLRVLDAGDTTPLTEAITAAQAIINNNEVQDAAFGLEIPRNQQWANKTALQAAISEAQTLISTGGTQSEINAVLAMFNASSGNGFGYIMKPVPAGRFQRDDNAANITEITKAYKMGQWEVTQELWTAVMGVNYSFNKTDDDPLLPVDGASDGGTGGTNMSFPHMIVFCNKLSELAGKTPVYTRTGGAPIPTNTYPTGWWTDVEIDPAANGYRLPTEMEWMWAAMGANLNAGDMSGGVNIKGYKKDFAGDSNPDTPGDSPDLYAWTATYSAGNGSLGQTWPAVMGNTGGSSGNNQTSFSKPVGGKLPNELGLYDMSGNLTEFCVDLTADSFTGSLWGDGPLTDWYQSTGGRVVVIGGDYGGNYPVTVSRAQWENNKICANNWAHRYYGFRIAANAD